MRKVTASLADPTAIIESGAEIGSNTRVWHHAHIREGAVIGSDSSIGKNVYIDAGVTIGSRVKIQNNVSVYRGVTIADDVFLGPSCVFTNDRYPRANSADWQVIATTVSRGASIGANATVLCGVTLGEWSAVGAGALVTHDVAAHQLVIGSPARPAGWVCRCGRVASRAAGSRPPHDDRGVQCEQCKAATV